MVCILTSGFDYRQTAGKNSVPDQPMALLLFSVLTLMHSDKSKIKIFPSPVSPLLPFFN